MREISSRCRVNISCCSPPSSLCTRDNDTVIKAHGCIIKEEEQLGFGLDLHRSSPHSIGQAESLLKERRHAVGCCPSSNMFKATKYRSCLGRCAAYAGHGQGRSHFLWSVHGEVDLTSV